MNLLALDTATEACSCALWQDGAVRTRVSRAGRDHTQQLLPQLQSLLAESGLAFAQIDGLVVGIGPGSFAGVRIGVAAAKGLALALDRPVWGVSSLALLAAAAPPAASMVCAALDARLDAVYAQAFQRDAQGLPEPLAPAEVVVPAALRWPVDGPCVAVGTGWARYPEALAASLTAAPLQTDGSALPLAEAGFGLARRAWAQGAFGPAATLQPLYLRDKVALTLIEQQARRQAGEG